MENIKIEDDSGDRRYFTMIPNYIANHSTANDQALYMQMKRVAGENGKCTASKEYFMKQLGIGKKALKISLEYLITHGWIELIGQGGGLTKQINTYRIVDIWKLNADYFEQRRRGSERDTLKGGLKKNERGSEMEVKGGSKEAIEEEPIKNNQEEEIAKQSFAPVKITSFFNKKQKDDGVPMTNQEFSLLCRSSEYRHIRLIGEYAESKEFDHSTRGQWRVFGLRNMRVARLITPFNDRQIDEAITKIEKDLDSNGGFISSWTMETLEKYLHKK